MIQPPCSLNPSVYRRLRFTTRIFNNFIYSHVPTLRIVSVDLPPVLWFSPGCYARMSLMISP